jgi:hypothetical protein
MSADDEHAASTTARQAYLFREGSMAASLEGSAALLHSTNVLAGSSCGVLSLT